MSTPTPEVLDEKNVTVAFDAAFDETDDFKNFDITGSGHDNDIYLWDLQKSAFTNYGNIDIDIDGGGGDDSLIYYDARSITVTAYDGSYDLYLDGGQGTGNDRFNLDSLEVRAKDIEEYYLSARGDTIDLSGLTQQLDVMINSFEGNDTFTGSDYNDHFEGGAGNDTIKGGAGADTIQGGDHDDYLEGGSGSDTFIFDNSDGNDIITDFRTADELYFEGASVDDIQFNGDTLTFDSTTVELWGFGSTTSDDFTLNDDTNGTWVTWNGTESAAGDNTVICTYMFQRGYIPADVYTWDGVYGQRLGAEVLEGYHAWAIPLVEHVLKRSEIATQLVRPFACAWALEMAHRCDPDSHSKGSLLGRAILAVGVPLCRNIARLRSTRAETVA